MRQIGVLPSTADPRVLGDHLLALGITTRVVESADGWAVWVHNEDLIGKAAAELQAYRDDPEDPRFRAASRAALEARKESERLDRLYQKNVRSLSGRWGKTDLRRRPLTALLVAACVAVFLVCPTAPAPGDTTTVAARVWDKLGFFSLRSTGQPVGTVDGLKDIHGGEVWRLVTPIFLHLNILHIVFNVWVTLVEGTLIETRRGTRTLAALVLLSAVVSNVGQYVYVLNFYKFLIPWGGISGVGYALFGYIWMKGHYEPEQGMMLHPTTVRVMIFWLLLGFAGVFPMANGAHVSGLIVGVLFGLARF